MFSYLICENYKILNREELIKRLNYTKAYRKTRLEVADWVLAHPELFPDLLQQCYNQESDMSYKASWILEFVCKARLELLYPELDLFCANLKTISKDQAKRPFAKICEILCLEYYKKQNPKSQKVVTNAHKELITEACFDWLINNEKVACKAYSIQALYLLGTEFDWIHPELKIILRQGYNSHSAAFKARARQFLQKLE